MYIVEYFFTHMDRTLSQVRNNKNIFMDIILWILEF